jgi:hypothetical protein
MSIETAIEIASKTELTMEEKMSYHLSLGFQTPLSPALVPVLVEVLWLYENGRDMSAEVALPEGIDYNGFPCAPAQTIFKEFQLKYFASDFVDA